jgi:hypothetical protein
MFGLAAVVFQLHLLFALTLLDSGFSTAIGFFASQAGHCFDHCLAGFRPGDAETVPMDKL